MKSKVNKTFFTITVSVLILLFLNGCGATGKQFSEFAQPTNDQGLIYIYRPSNFEASAMDQVVYDITNNKTIGLLKNNGYIQYLVKPGDLTIAVSSNPNIGHAIAGFLLVDLSTVAIAETINPSEKPKRVFTIKVKPNIITCLRWSASSISNTPNGVVDNKTCRKEIGKTRQSIN